MKSKYSDEQLRNIETRIADVYLENYGHLASTAKAFDLSRQQLAGLIATHPRIQAAYQTADAQLTDDIEAATLKHALNPKGGVNFTPSIFMLKTRRRERYGDRQTIDVNETGYSAAINSERKPASSDDTASLSIVPATGTDDGG